MYSKKKPKKKKKTSRLPAETISLRLNPALIEKIDATARKFALTRTEILRSGAILAIERLEDQ